MNKTIRRVGVTSVQIRPQILRMLQQEVRKGYSKTEIINEALRRYLVEKEFEEIRGRLAPLAQARGIYTDEDVIRILK